MLNVIEEEKLSFDERALANFLQGSLNKYGVNCLIDTKPYLRYVDEQYEYIDLYLLLDKNVHLFSGYVLYDLSDSDVSINMATMLCATNNYLGIPRTLENKIKKYQLPLIADMADIKGSNSIRQKTIFDQVYVKLNKKALVHQVVKPNNFHLCLRDDAIFNGFACIYTSESAEDKIFRSYVLKKLDSNIPIYGWTDDELSFVRDVSMYGDYVIPSDWSSNHSYFSKKNLLLLQKRTNINVNPNKHYLCLVVSDGDNVQWMETSFLINSTMKQRVESGSNYKLNFTFPPLLLDKCPNCAKEIFNLKKNNYFITGVSGIGYMNPSSFPIEHLDDFIKQTENAMKKCDINEVCILDNLDHTSEDNLIKSLKYYSKSNQISGGILELDPDRYESGKGKCYFIDGKPFVSVKYSLWHDKKDTKRVFLNHYIDMINNEKPNIYSISGYTVVNIHPWSMNISDIDYLVSKLEKHIEIVYVNELIDLIKENVK